MRTQESKQVKGRKDETENENTWGGKFQREYVHVPWRTPETSNVETGK